MSTLMRNIGILDARQAKPEQIQEIGKIDNVGALVVSAANKAEFLKISMQNIGKTLELDDDYKLQVGHYNMTKQMLEDSDSGIKLCIVGQIYLDDDIPAELLKVKLLGLYLVGQATVPEHLYGVFMSAAKDITGIVSKASQSGKKILGNVIIDDNYLNALEDGTELGVVGNVTLAEKVDAELFLTKISRIKVVGNVKCLDSQTEMLGKVWSVNEVSRLKVIKADYHYLSSGTKLDAFALMKVVKPVISCSGQLILDEEITSDLLKDKDKTFDVKGGLYFPKLLMKEMSTRLTADSRGLPYEPGKFEVFGEVQNLTNVRLSALQEMSTLVVLGELEIDSEIKPEAISSKVGILDNYGKIIANKDVASILQSKLRQNEGMIEIRGEEEAQDEDSAYSSIIENTGSYIF